MEHEQIPLFYIPKPEPKKARRKIIDPEATHEITEDAVERAENLSDDDRKEEMFRAIERAATKYPVFTIDDIWEELGQVGDDRDDGSGIGPVMRKASGMGMIEKTGDFQRSNRPATHGKPVPIWKSLIFVGGISP